MVGSPVSSRNNKDDSACDAHFEAGPLRTASRRGSINLGTPFINKGETGLLKMLRFWERNPYEATPGRCTAPRRCVARRGLRQPTVRMWQSSNQSLTPHPAKPPWFVKTAVRPRSGPPAHPFEQSVRSRFPPAIPGFQRLLRRSPMAVSATALSPGAPAPSPLPSSSPLLRCGRHC